MIETTKQTVFSLVLLLALYCGDAADRTTPAAFQASSSNQGLEHQVVPEVRRLSEKKENSYSYDKKKGKENKLAKDDDSSDKGKGKKGYDYDYSKGKGKGKKEYDDYSKGKGGGKKDYKEEEKYTKGKGGGKKSSGGGGDKECDENSCCISDPLFWSQDPWLPVEDKEDGANRTAIPALTQPFYNEVNDVHATVSAKDTKLILSVNGNWYPALARLLNEVYFPKDPSYKDSYLYTTSPPIGNPQTDNGILKVGNVLFTDAAPHYFTGAGFILNQLGDKVDNDTRENFISTYGSVILKRKGDTNINKFWDLKKLTAERFATSDPRGEPGSFTNAYRFSVYNIALNMPRRPYFSNETIYAEAEALRDQLFNENVVTIGQPMWRSIPHVIANNEADAGLLFLHLAVAAMRDNPGVFSAIYLDKNVTGETSDPEVLVKTQRNPLEGNRVGTFAIVKTSSTLIGPQNDAGEDFLEALRSDEFTKILDDEGLRRNVL